MMLDAKSYAADTNSACKVEFTELKSSHTGIESTQQPSTAPRECPVNYKAPLFRGPLLLHILHDENRLFLSCGS